MGRGAWELGDACQGELETGYGQARRSNHGVWESRQGRQDGLAPQKDRVSQWPGAVRALALAGRLARGSTGGPGAMGGCDIPARAAPQIRQNKKFYGGRSPRVR